jgi:hypothetical protein
MTRASRSLPQVNWELLRREAQRLLAGQPAWLAVGLAGPLLIALYSLFRPGGNADHAGHVLYAARLLADWHLFFGLAYSLNAWLGQQTATERALLHLPLSPVHFALRRLLHTSGIPLLTAALSLGPWLAVVIRYWDPYAASSNWTDSYFYMPDPPGTLWLARIAWTTAAILGAALLPAALAAWLDTLDPVPALRCVLLLGTAASGWLLTKLLQGMSYDAQYGWSGYGYGSFSMNYRQGDGVAMWPYLLAVAQVLVLPVLYGYLRPAWRWAIVALPIALLGLILAREFTPGPVKRVLRPVLALTGYRDARYAEALLLGHLSPPVNIQLLLERYWSNVLFRGAAPFPEPREPEPQYPPEPEYPAHLGSYNADDPAWQAYDASMERWNAETAPQRKQHEQALNQYRVDSARYEAQKEHWPRLPLWVGAGLYPLLLPVWAVAGMLLGIHLRPSPRLVSARRKIAQPE